jgi:hypothetical protein
MKMKETRKYDSTERGKERSKQEANAFEAPQFRLDVDVFENRAIRFRATAEVTGL